jgi:hypothetical protein
MMSMFRNVSSIIIIIISPLQSTTEHRSVQLLAITLDFRLFASSYASHHGSNLYNYYIHKYIPLTLYPRTGSRDISDIPLRHPFYQNLLAMKNTADVTGGNPIAVFLQSITGVSAINPLVAFYDIHGGKREVLFFYFVPDTT